MCQGDTCCVTATKSFVSFGQNGYLTIRICIFTSIESDFSDKGISPYLVIHFPGNS